MVLTTIRVNQGRVEQNEAWQGAKFALKSRLLTFGASLGRFGSLCEIKAQNVGFDPLDVVFSARSSPVPRTSTKGYYTTNGAKIV